MVIRPSGEVVRLEAGDLLVAFTDGISEVMNHADDEWGEERLIEVARAMRRAPAKAILGASGGTQYLLAEIRVIFPTT